MKNKLLIIVFLFITFFISINKIDAQDKIIKSQTDDKVMFIVDRDGEFLYSWTFDKNEYKNHEKEFDLGIKFNTPNKNSINKLINKNIEKEFISFNYHGNLESVATIKLPVKKFKDGSRLNLYYYNEEANEIDKMQNNILVVNGYVTFDINHCSDYFLTMSVIKEAKNENNSGVIIIGMIIVIVGLVGYTIFKNKK